MKYGDYLGTAISQHMTSKYLTKSLTHLLQARIVEVIMYDCPVLVSSARSSISKPLIEIYIFEIKKGPFHLFQHNFTTFTFIPLPDSMATLILFLVICGKV